MNPLHKACEWGQVGAVRALLYFSKKKGTQNSSISLGSSRDENGCTPLHIAAKFGHYDIVEILVQTDPNLVNAIADNGWTPLHYATSGGHFLIVVYLVEHDAKINKCGLFGTPLHCAVRKGKDLKIVKYLINHGALLNTKSPTPLDVACQLGNRKMVKLLLDKGAEPGDSVHYAMEHPKILRILIKERASLCTLKNKRSIFDHDWVRPLLEVDKFSKVLINKDLHKCWNLLSLICWHEYGKHHDIELFQLTDDKENIKIPKPGSKYLSSKYLATPEENTPPPTPASVESTTAAVENELRPTTIISSEDRRILIEVLEGMNQRAQNTPADTTVIETEDQSVAEQQQQQEHEEIFQIVNGILPDFKSASHDDFCWMLHAAASIPVCPVHIIKFLCHCFPNQLRVQRNGYTPLLSALTRDSNQAVSNLYDKCTHEVVSFILQTFPGAASVPDDNNVLPLLHAVRTKKTWCIQELVHAYPESLQKSLDTYAVHVESVFDFTPCEAVTLDFVYQLVRQNPAAFLNHITKDDSRQ